MFCGFSWHVSSDKRCKHCDAVASKCYWWVAQPPRQNSWGLQVAGESISGGSIPTHAMYRHHIAARPCSVRKTDIWHMAARWLFDAFISACWWHHFGEIWNAKEQCHFFFAAFFRWWIQCSLLYILNFHPQSTKYWEGEDFAAGNSFPRPPGAEEPWLLMWQSCWWPHTDYNAKHGRTSWPGAQWKWTKHRIWSIWSSFSPQKRFLSSGGIAHLKRQTQRTCRAAAS